MGVEDNKKTIIPNKINLHGNYPNPINPSTEIRLELASSYDNVILGVYNITGQVVNVISIFRVLSGMQRAMCSGLDHNGASVSSGIYFYNIQAGTNKAMGKVTLLKSPSCVTSQEVRLINQSEAIQKHLPLRISPFTIKILTQL